MFDTIAARYDLANHLLSGGADFWWRHRAAAQVQSWRPERLLDLATGTGDLALAISRKLPMTEITGADFSSEMLALARRKGLQRTVVADALQLPFEDGSFDCVTVAFGLRNMVDWAAAIREIARVISADGHLLILDFSVPSGVLRSVYRFYLHSVLPHLAAVVTGNKNAYDYLGASIEQFPRGKAMTALITANCFRSAISVPLTGGIATMYTAVRRDRTRS